MAGALRWFISIAFVLAGAPFPHAQGEKAPGARPNVLWIIGEERTALDTWIAESDDQGRFPEPPEVLEYWEAQMEKNYGERLRKRREEEAGDGR